MNITKRAIQISRCGGKSKLLSMILNAAIQNVVIYQPNKNDKFYSIDVNNALSPEYNNLNRHRTDWRTLSPPSDDE